MTVLLLLPGNTLGMRSRVSGSIQRIIYLVFDYCIDVCSPGRATVSDRGETHFFHCADECERLLVIPGAGRWKLKSHYNL